MEVWYPKLAQYTIPSVQILLGPEHINCLLGQPVNDMVRQDLSKMIGQAFVILGGNRFFIRLGSVSPKDVSTMVTDIDTVFEIFAKSERAGKSLKMSQQFQYTPSLYIRQWVDIDKTREFRCFVKNNELKGISQYYCYDTCEYLNDDNIRDLLISRVKALFEHIHSRVGLNSYVFDIVYRDEELPLLLEINPYSGWTGTCLFDWTEDNFEGNLELRYYGRE